ncbi:hypothetical protein PPL_01093 [Heterostelium album PN500]|uniref:Uncharacterized protein n=1 Tax=Heterostelium pallidum (strain ATCC 26659 / Pp 5 / PN500) TaxID=670386 RepID=D3AY34_HETP5|nr:hypothetical protein PPL_01093 [Heterostelium album PN500]EFA85861.1 hypothetical protein PPL_01093 [Heterostelium album PN500]|eukprot:XP_020437967.1 hypothetical protein PPL_01093 [Heterostelium album PN500]
MTIIYSVLYLLIVLSSCLNVIVLSDGNNQPNLYNFDLSDIVEIAGLSYHRLNYFPDVTPTQYTYFPHLEGYMAFSNKIFTLNKSISWDVYSSQPDIYPPMTSNCGIITSNCGFNLLVIENGGILKYFNTASSNMAIVVKAGGVIELDPQKNVNFVTSMLVLYPGSTFISHPSSTVTHTISPSFPTFSGPTLWRERDPFQVSSFLCLGCTIDILSSRSAQGVPASFVGLADGIKSCITTTYPNFDWTNPIANNGKTGLVPPVIGNDSLLLLTSIPGNYLYTPACKEPYIDDAPVLPAFTMSPGNDPNIMGANFIYTFENSSNVNINGVGIQRSSIFITGNSSVTISGATFDKIGSTDTSPFDDTTWDGATLLVGNNIPDRYPITLFQVTNYVTITNNVFRDAPVNSTLYTSPRFIIGVKRSFGTINNNAFLLRTPEATGIGFLHGTEEFEVSFNTFSTPILGNISQPDYGIYPDVRPGNTGVYTVSPYITLKNNSFQGGFQDASVIIEPLTNRVQLTGMNTEPLIGKYAGQFQNNSQPIYTLWNQFLWSGMEENKFFRTSFPRIKNYPASSPSLTLRFYNSIFYKMIGANFRTTKATVFNYDLVFDQSYITGFFSRLQGIINIGPNNVFVGNYRGLSLINSNVSMAFNQLANSYFRDIIHNENSLFTSNISLPTQYQNYSPQLALKNSPLSYCDDTGSTTVSVFKVLPDPSIPLTQPNFTYTIIYDAYNTYNISVTVDDIPVITNVVYNNTRVANVAINITNFTPGYHKVMVTSFPLLKRYGGTTPNGYNYRYSLTYQANVVSNYLVVPKLNFYLGIDINPDIDSRKAHLPIFDQQWTRCQWVSDICQISGGTYSKFDNPLPSITDGVTTVTNGTTINMLSTFYGNSNGQGSSITINLQPGYYQLFLYYANPTNVQPQYTQSTSLPRFSVTINDQFVTPLTRTFANYQQYQRAPEIIINNDGSSSKSYKIQWGYNGIYTPLSGIEIYSSLSTPYPIPNDPEDLNIANRNHQLSLTLFALVLFSTVFLFFV